MATHILALIVVYGMNPDRSTSLQTLLSNTSPGDNLTILVWDNSPSPSMDAARFMANGMQYISTPENLGLSTIYNRVIKGHLADNSYLLLLDQDSELPTNFLNECVTAIEAEPDIDLFLPMVRANGAWRSPLTYILGWGRNWSSPRKGRIPSRGVCAINSGMLISAHYLLGDFPGYDERLRFYGTDTQFMLEYMKRRPELAVLDTTIEHDLSFFSASREAQILKFQEMRKAYSYIYEKQPLLEKTGMRAVMSLVSLIYALRYRAPKLLRMNW